MFEDAKPMLRNRLGLMAHTVGHPSGLEETGQDAVTSNALEDFECSACGEKGHVAGECLSGTGRVSGFRECLHCGNSYGTGHYGECCSYACLAQHAEADGALAERARIVDWLMGP